jgi:hypothetical protein
MISPVTGETTFQDLRILPQSRLPEGGSNQTHALPIAGWSGHRLGSHRADRGLFDVEVITGPQRRIQVLLMSHIHPFYEAKTPGDAERRVFHEGLIISELAGQREFSWGEVLCRFDAKANKDWLVLAFTPGPHVQEVQPPGLLHLLAHEHGES